MHSENKNQSIEKILHKYETEIRSHIKLEQEFKKIAEETEKRYELLRNDYLVMSGKYNEMILRLSDLSYLNDNLMEDNQKIKAFMHDNNIEIPELMRASSKSKTMSIAKVKRSRNSRPISTDFVKVQANKLKRVTSGNSSICSPYEKIGIGLTAPLKRHAKTSIFIRQ